MGFEIERKFLIDHKKILFTNMSFSLIKQGYLRHDIERVVRIRKKNQHAFLTIKGKNKGATRLEMEYPIPINDAEDLFNLCLPHIIEKKRYEIEIGKHLWEIDCF